MTSDPSLLDAFRKQCLTLKRSGESAYLALIAWQGQAGVDPDDLIDIVKEVEADDG